MRTYLLLLTFIFSNYFSSFAQWQLLDLGTGSTGQKMEVINESTAFITYSKGKILKTVDSGFSWGEIEVDFLDEETLYDIDFGNEQIGIITIRSDFIIRTTDQGENWEKISLTAFSDGSGDITLDPAAEGNSSVRIESICFYDTDTALVTLSWKDGGGVYHSYLWKSTNEGADWTRLPNDLHEVLGNTGSSITFNGLVFPDAQQSGYLIGSRGTILKLENLGQQVEKVDLTDHALDGKSINDLYIDNGEVYLATQVGLYHTTDDFASIVSLTSEYIFDVIKLSDGTILQGGSTSKDATKRSLDNGNSWQLAENGVGNLFELQLFGDLLYGLSTSGKTYTLPPSHLLDPVVEFEYLTKGKIVEFENKSQNTGTAHWDFSDETISDEQAPTHLFEELGTYWVKLSVENALGVVTDSLLVDIDPMLADFQPSFIAGNVVEFIHNCENYYEIVGWDFGDNQHSELENPEHVFGQFGTYIVKLSASDGLDTISVEVPLIVDEISTPWFTEQMPASNTLSKFGVADDQNAVIIGSNTTILHTADGGETWSNAFVPEDIPGHIANDVVFFNDQKGLASFSAKSSVNGFLLKTDDAGKTWTELPLTNLSDQSGDGSTDIALGSKVYFYGLANTDENTAFVTTRWEHEDVKHGYIFKTTDGGATWAKSSGDIYNGFTSVYTTLEFSPNKQSAVLAGVKKLWISNDGGDTWNEQEAASFGSINDVEFLNDTTIFLACQYGTYKSTDTGETWIEKTEGDYSFDVIAVDDQTLFTGKNEETCRMSTDKGETWEPAGLGIGSTFFELFNYNDKLYALSSKGKVYSNWLDNIYPAEALFEQMAINSVESAASPTTVLLSNQSENATHFYWDFGDGTTSISDESEVVHEFPSLGTYEVALIASNKTTRDTIIQTVFVLHDGVESLSVYPNPCKSGNDLTIDLGNSSNIASVSIVDAVGNVVFRQENGIDSGLQFVDINNLSSGIYLVVVRDISNKSITRKLIVQ